MQNVFDSDLVTALAIVIPVVFVSSIFINRGYAATYKKLQNKYGGSIRTRWWTFPAYSIPQSGGEIILSAISTSGSRLGMTLADTWLPQVPAFQFSVVSRKIPNRSFFKTPENWNPDNDADFSARFKSYSLRPDMLNLILMPDIRNRIIALDSIQPVRLSMDISNQAPHLGVSVYPNTNDLAVTEKLLELCVLLRNHILALGDKLPVSAVPASSIPIKPLFK